MKKSILMIILIMTVTLMLAGCSSVPKEEEIQQDLESFSDKAFLDDGEKIDSLTIEKRDTDKKNKSDLVWCTIVTEKDDVSYEKEVTLSYYLYDKAGWTLEDYKVADQGKWNIIPLSGVKETDLRSNLVGKTITVDNQAWEILDSEISQLTIKSQNTDLEKKTDQITMDIVLDGEIESVSGTLVADYTFDKAWNLSSLSEKYSLRPEVKEDKALDVSMERVVDDIQYPEIKYGVSGAIQKITISKDQMEDFSVDKQISQYKGTEQSFQCSAKLVKGHAIFNVSINADYIFENGTWNCSQIEPELTFASADLQGEWKGTYREGGGNGTVNLNITEVDGNNMKETYSYTPYGSSKWDEPGSYEVEGEFVPEGLTIAMKAGDWIDEPEKHLSGPLHDISAVLYVDDDILKGMGHESSLFELTKQ